MEKRITAIIVLIILSFSGCSVSSPSDQMEHKEIENQEQTTEGNGKNEAKSEEPKETSTTDTKGDISLGNVFNAEFKSLLESKRIQEIKKAFEENKRIEKLCQSCEFFKTRLSD